MSMYRFTPALVLAAAGSYAGAADATVITQDFNVAPGSAFTKNDITIGSNASAQFELIDTPPTTDDNGQITGPAGRFFTTYEGSFIGDTNLDGTFPTQTGTSGAIKLAPASGDQYVQLSFDLNGTETFGVADFASDLTLKSVSYDVAPPSSVPEPAVWMELIVGFGMAGSALRASRRQRQLAIAR
jgi:hypothetical protein